MRRGNQRIRKARAAKRRWLVAEHLTRAGDAAGPRLMEVLIRAGQHRQRYLSPQFVRATAESFAVNRCQINLEPQFGVTDEQIHHIAMSLLCELKHANVPGRFSADSHRQAKRLGRCFHEPFADALLASHLSCCLCAGGVDVVARQPKFG